VSRRLTFLTIIHVMNRLFFKRFYAGPAVLAAGSLAFGPAAAPAAAAKAQAPSTVYTFEFVPEKADRTFRDFLEFARKTARGRESLRAQYLVAELCILKGDYKQAADILQNLAGVALDDEFFNVSVLQKLADCYMRMGLFEQASQAYASVSKSDVKAIIPEAILGLAVTSLASGDREQAYLRFQELVSFYPSYKNLPHALLPLGLIQWENQRYQDALEYFIKDDKNPASLYFAGLCQRSIRKMTDAMGTFKKITQDHPKTVWAERARYELGETFYRQKDYALAEKMLHGIAADYRGGPWETLALYRLACADMQVARYKHAEEKLWGLEKRMEKDPLQPNVTYLLTEALAQQDKMPQLVKHLQREIKDKKMSPDNTYRLIWALVAVGKYDEAIELSNDFLNNHWDRELTPKTLLVQGYAYGRTDRAPEAVATYQLVVDRFPESAFAAQALHLMATAYFRSKQYGPIVTQVNHQWNSLPSDVRKRNPAAMFWIAEAHLQMDRGADARKVYDRFLDMAPPDHPLVASALLGQAVSYAVDNNYDSAILTLQRSYQTAQERNDKALMATLMFETGNMYFNAKDYENAAASYRTYQQIDAKHPEVPTAMYREGMALHRAEYYSDAVAAWDKLVKDHPRHALAPEALFRAGKTRFDMGQYPEAVKNYTGLVKTYSKHALAKDARLQVAQAYYNAGDYAKAIVHYSDFLNRYPADPQAPNVLQLLQTTYFRANKSPEEIEKLTAKQPKSAVLAEIYWEQGAKFYNEKNYDKAREYFQKILLEFLASSVAAQAAFYRAESLYLQEKFVEAAPAFQSFVQAHPEDAQAGLAKFHLAVSLFNQNNFAEAGKAFEDFAKTYPDDPMAKNAALNVALCYAKDQDVDNALEAYRRYVQLYPSSEDVGAVYVQMGVLLEKAGRDKDAAEVYMGVPGHLPERAEALVGAGRSYRKLNDTQGERQAYEALLEIPAEADPYRIAGLLQLAEIYMTQNQAAKAQAVYQDVARNAKDQESAALAQERMKMLQGGGGQ
jgi:TolA-binding protein